MKKRLRMPALFLAAAMIMSIGTGCKNQNTDVAEDGRTILTVGNWPNKESDPKGYERMEKNKEQFEKENPDVMVKEDEWNYDLQTFAAKAEGETLPTVYQTHFTEADKIINGGYAADLTDCAKKYGIYGSIDHNILENISKEGKMYLVPMSSYDLGIMMNTSLFEEAGLLEADGSPKIPKTFDELAETAKIIREKTGKAGFVLPTSENMGGWIFTSIAWNFGVKFMEETDDGWKSTFNSPECVEALQYIKDLRWKYNALPVSSNINAAELSKQIGTGQAAMSIAHAGQADACVKSYGMDPLKLGFAKMPAGPKDHVTMMGGAYYAIPNTATEKQIDAAFRWITFSGTKTTLNDEEMARIESDYKAKKEENSGVVGLLGLSIWSDDVQARQFDKEMNAKYSTVDPKNVASFNNKDDINYQVEEPVCAQDLYALLDGCIQAVISDENADCAALLEKASSDFQTKYLDYEGK